MQTHKIGMCVCVYTHPNTLILSASVHKNVGFSREEISLYFIHCQLGSQEQCLTYSKHSINIAEFLYKFFVVNIVSEKKLW